MPQMFRNRAQRKFSGGRMFVHNVFFFESFKDAIHRHQVDRISFSQDPSMEILYGYCLLCIHEYLQNKPATLGVAQSVPGMCDRFGLGWNHGGTVSQYFCICKYFAIIFSSGCLCTFFHKTVSTFFVSFVPWETLEIFSL